MRRFSDIAAVRGFTLVELLVVISIVALLMSLLLPSLWASRVVVVRTTCMSNQRGTLVALNAYAQDFRDYPFNADQGVSAIDYFPGGGGDYWGAPIWQGLEGQYSYWRAYLILNGYAGSYSDGPDPATGGAYVVDGRGLGCADSLALGAEATAVSKAGSTNFLENSLQIRKSPPYVYLGPGVDTIREASYITGVGNNWSDSGTSRAGRSFKFPNANPLLMCSDIMQNTAVLTNSQAFCPHSRKPYGAGDRTWGISETWWYDRTIDMNVGWTDGTVRPMAGHAFQDTFFSIPNYNWDNH